MKILDIIYFFLSVISKIMSSSSSRVSFFSDLTPRLNAKRITSCCDIFNSSEISDKLLSVSSGIRTGTGFDNTNLSPIL
jgi:hypothetical protein